MDLELRIAVWLTAHSWPHGISSLSIGRQSSNIGGHGSDRSALWENCAGRLPNQAFTEKYIVYHQMNTESYLAPWNSWNFNALVTWLPSLLRRMCFVIIFTCLSRKRLASIWPRLNVELLSQRSERRGSAPRLVCCSVDMCLRG